MGLFKPDITYRNYYYLFLALAAAIPIHGRLVPPIILLIGINWILELNFREKFKRLSSFRGSKYLMGFTLIYLWYVIGTLYSSRINSQDGAVFILEVKLSLLLFPIFFSTIDFTQIRKGFYRKVQYVFIVGCIISMLLLLNNAVFNYFQTKSMEAFYYINLGFVHHPSYIALYFTFAIAILLNWVLGYQGKSTLKRNAAILLMLIFQVFIVLLSSKAGILATALIYLVTLIYNIIHRSWGKAILMPVVLLGVFIATLFLFPRSYERFYAAESAVKAETNTQSQDGSDARMMVWEVSLDLIKTNPIFGVGTGDVEPEMMKLYKERDIRIAMDEMLNSHNQYLQTFIALGIPGILLLLGMLFVPALWSVRKKHLLYLLFLAIFSFNLLVESMLERQGGVVFYAFFNSFLFYFAFTEEKN